VGANPRIRTSSKNPSPKGVNNFIDMSSYRQILYHLVFRTKDSRKTIVQEHSRELYFEDKLRRLLKEHGIEFDEKYFP